MCVMVLCVEGLKPSACGLTLCCPLTIQTCNHRRILLQETCIISQDPEAQRCYRDIILKPVWFWGSITKCGWFTELCGLQGCRSLNALCWGGSLQAYHLNSKRKSLDQKTDTPASGPLNADDLPGCIFFEEGHLFRALFFSLGISFWMPLSSSLLFFASLLFCFSAFLFFCFSESAFLLFSFFAFLLLWIFAFIFFASTFFVCLSASLLLCFSACLFLFFVSMFFGSLLCLFSAFVAFFPNSASLGSSAIVKVPEKVGAAKSARCKVGNRVPGKGLLFQENPSEQRTPHGGGW